MPASIFIFKFWLVTTKGQPTTNLEDNKTSDTIINWETARNFVLGIIYRFTLLLTFLQKLSYCINSFKNNMFENQNLN